MTGVWCREAPTVSGLRPYGLDSLEAPSTHTNWEMTRLAKRHLKKVHAEHAALAAPARVYTARARTNRARSFTRELFRIHAWPYSKA